jgi:hypothetical protein
MSDFSLVVPKTVAEQEPCQLVHYILALGDVGKKSFRSFFRNAALNWFLSRNTLFCPL